MGAARESPATQVLTWAVGKLNRALQAETRADTLAKRVDELESKLAARNSHSEVNLLPSP
jgi:hypothetical protein